jgi:adenylosuccinate synthase
MTSQNNLVLGLGFGDEGKGLVTDWLCSQILASNKRDNINFGGDPIVIRFSGGHQAGHTVYSNGVHHVFSNFGSGTLQGCPTMWMPTCTVDPVGLVKERSILVEKGIQPELYIHSKCPITTPYDKIYNRYLNERNGHGSVGVGVGATFERQENHYSLLFEDLFYPSVLKIKMDMIADYYWAKLSEFSISGENPFGHIDEKDLQKFYSCVQFLVTTACTDAWLGKTQEVNSIPNNIIMEGSQGLLLDPTIGFFPHVTRSNLFPQKTLTPITDVYFVTRAYQTRHGNGPMTNYKQSYTIKKNPEETNVDNYQGEFRRAMLDIDLLQYVLEKYKYIQQERHLHCNHHLVITCLDHLESPYKYTKNGVVCSFNKEIDFIRNIRKNLGISIDEVHVSHSPYSNAIETVI